MINMKEIYDTEKFIAEKIESIDLELSKKYSKDSFKNEEKYNLIESAWYTLSRNILWLLDNYRRNNSNIYTLIKPIPLYEVSFACRLIMETIADFRYYYEHDSEIETFLKEKDDYENNFDETWKKITSKKYSLEYCPNKKTVERIEEYADRDGIGFYNMLCWTTHFNYFGYIIASNEEKACKIYASSLLYILDSLKTFSFLLKIDQEKQAFFDKHIARLKGAIK